MSAKAAEDRMPTYQYACTSCGEELEAVQKFSDDPLTECPACGGRLRKVFSAVGVVFKGSGFYKTDSRSTAKKKTGGDSSSTSEDKSAGSKGDSESSKSGSKSSKSGSEGSKSGSEGSKSPSGDGGSSGGSSSDSSGSSTSSSSSSSGQVA